MKITVFWDNTIASIFRVEISLLWRLPSFGMTPLLPSSGYKSLFYLMMKAENISQRESTETTQRPFQSYCFQVLHFLELLPCSCNFRPSPHQLRWASSPLADSTNKRGVLGSCCTVAPIHDHYFDRSIQAWKLYSRRDLRHLAQVPHRLSGLLWNPAIRALQTATAKGFRGTCYINIHVQLRGWL
jgi:hypothetical protein